jgi:hypothetical protein
MTWRREKERKVYWEIGSLDEISCVCSVASVEVISPCARLIPNFLGTESGFLLAIWCLKEKQATLSHENQSLKKRKSNHARLLDRNLDGVSATTKHNFFGLSKENS